MNIWNISTLQVSISLVYNTAEIKILEDYYH